MMNAGLGAIAPRNPNPMASQPQPFQQLLALNEAVKTANLQRAAQGQQAMSQAQQMPPTIKDQLEMALQQIQAQQPVPGMASGGMVAFDKGGLAEADLEGLDEDLVAEGLLDRPIVDYIIERLGGNVPQPRERPGAQERAASRDAAALEQAYRDPNRPPTFAAPAGLAAAAAATPPAGPTPPARPPAARTAGGAGVGGAGGAAAPQRGGLAEYLRMTEQLAKDVEGTAAVDPRVLEARQAYDAMLKASMDPAEQQMRELEAQQALNIFENPELMSAILEGMKGTDRLGDTLMGAATGLVRARAGQKKEQREAKANLVKLRQELAKAEAEARLARAEKDVEGEQRAKLKAAEIRAAMNEKSYELQTRRISADASAISASRPASGSSEESVELKRMQIMRQDPKYSGLAKEYEEAVKLLAVAPSNPRAQERVRNAEAALNQLAQEYGVARMGSTPGQASAAPGATTAGWGTAKVVNP